MPNYLTKEEIRQWRSSLEKITLEEYAARLGKVVEESKTTNDVVDIVMSRGTSSNTNRNVKDGFSRIAERAFKRERQISHTPFSINKKDLLSQTALRNSVKQNNTQESISDLTEKDKVLSKQDSEKEVILNRIEESSANSDTIVLKKALTDREQMVFEYFLNNIGKTVFAKDLAALLNLPRDYIYKYIKNLRAKIDGDKLRNAPSGGFVLID